MVGLAPLTDVPASADVVILGGGIHGVGILHDLVSRGITNVVLLERDRLGAGTSSKSTKLIHGGLRYLRHITQFPMVRKALEERTLLLNLLPDLVHPLEIVFPVLTSSRMPDVVIRAGLTLYDLLAGGRGILPHRRLSTQDARDKLPILTGEGVRSYYSFWDAQTDDRGLVDRIAYSATCLGGHLFQGDVASLAAAAADDSIRVTARSRDGTTTAEVRARVVVNGLGPWSNDLLVRSGLKPTHKAVRNKGIHVLTRDIGLKAGMLLESPTDGRIVFCLPWRGYTLIGTTESVHQGDADRLAVEEAEIDYLFERLRPLIGSALGRKDVLASFAGLRWMPWQGGPKKKISDASREYIVGVLELGRGRIYTIYGGKLTTYRLLACEVGTEIVRNLGRSVPESRTHLAESWFLPQPGEQDDVLARFHATAGA